MVHDRHNDHIILFGGCSYEGRHNNYLHLFDLKLCKFFSRLARSSPENGNPTEPLPPYLKGSREHIPCAVCQLEIGHHINIILAEVRYTIFPCARSDRVDHNTHMLGGVNAGCACWLSLSPGVVILWVASYNRPEAELRGRFRGSSLGLLKPLFLKLAIYRPTLRACR